MRDYKIKSIILKSRDLGDSGKIFTVFSNERGKISLKANGVKKIKSKLASHLDTLNLTEIHITKGRGNLDLITGATVFKSHKNIKKDLDSLALAYYFTELVDKLTITEQENKEIYSILSDTLDILDSKTDISKLNILKSAFTYKVIKAVGHKPRIDVCVFCGDSHNDVKKILFDFEHGGVLCENCDDKKIITEPISLDCLKTINALEKLDLESLMKISLKPKILLETIYIVDSFNDYTFQKVYKSKDFMKTIASLK